MSHCSFCYSADDLSAHKQTDMGMIEVCVWKLENGSGVVGGDTKGKKDEEKRRRVEAREEAAKLLASYFLK